MKKILKVIIKYLKLYLFFLGCDREEELIEYCKKNGIG